MTPLQLADVAERFLLSWDPPHLDELLDYFRDDAVYQDPRTIRRGKEAIREELEAHIAAIGGTTIEQSLIEGLRVRRVTATVVPVADYAAGVQMVRERRAAAMFGDRLVLVDAARSGPDAGTRGVWRTLTLKRTVNITFSAYWQTS